MAARVYKVGSLVELGSLMAVHNRAREKRIVKAIQKTAEDVRPVVTAKIPEAFRRLQKTLHVENQEKGAKLRADAPYAAAVEVGSRPHTPPLGPLIDWVLVKGYAKDMEEARSIAFLVQQKIRREGTSPVWYMRNSLPMIRLVLDAKVKLAVKD